MTTVELGINYRKISEKKSPNIWKLSNTFPKKPLGKNKKSKVKLERFLIEWKWKPSISKFVGLQLPVGQIYSTEHHC